jgi:hypothetical protein
MPDAEKQTLEVEAAVGTELPPVAEGRPEESEKPTNEIPAERPKAPEYEVVASQREMPETGFVADPDALAAVLAAANASTGKGAGASKGQKARLSDVSAERIQKFAANQTRVYAAVGIGLGLLAGLIVAVLFFHPNGQTGQIDMGPSNAPQYGLMGHLTTSWKDRLEYQVTIEPTDANHRAAFAANVNASPHPLSIELQAKDPFGAVLCSDTILLKFDPRNTPGIDVPDPGPKATKAQIALAERNRITQGIQLAKLEGQELDREHGKNIFQNDMGKNGQLASISAQGVLPCTRQQFEKVASWGFASNFPVVTPAQNAAAADAHGAPTAIEDARKETEAEKSAANAKTRRKPLAPLQPVYVEGDDSIVFIDAPNGVMETRGGKVLHTDKADAIAETLKGRDFPIAIHYRCDQEGNCTFGGVGTGVHHARLRK